jgi:predicted ATPase
LIRAESLRRPAVLCIEDAHWLDDDSLELLRWLVQGDRAFPFAVLLTSRYGDDGGRWALEVGPGVPQQVVDLATLPASGVRALAAQVLGGQVADGLAAFLAEKTEGNPFFAEQLALDLRERGLLACQEIEGRGLTYDLDLSHQSAAEEVPVSINAVLVARLDRLAAQVKAVVQTAAVLGHEFEVRVLTEMLQGDRNLADKVKQAEAQSIWSPLSEIRYLFKHTLLRDAAYDMQLLERLRELHRMAGTTIEMLYAGRTPPT